MKRWLCALLALLLVFSLAGCQFIIDVAEVLLEEDPAETTAYSSTTPKATSPKATTPKATTGKSGQDKLDKNGYYYTKEDVALYIHTYGCLPDNFITKKEAQALGWTGGSLEKYAPGKVIGGDYFGNYEGLLPSKKGRTYTECDIGTKGKSSRGSKRIVFSNDGLIFYTDDHYESFTRLY
jgi:hypothetical protein